MRELVAVVAALMGLGLAACSNDEACANNPRGFCGTGKWCEDLGATSRCRPVPDVRSLCGKEQWSGECAAVDGSGGSAGRSDAGDAGVLGEGGLSDSGADRGAEDAGGGVGGQIGDAAAVSVADTADVEKPEVPDARLTTDLPSTPDTRPTCADTCQLGTSRCGAGGLAACVKLPSGCAGWGDPVTCGRPQVCPDNKTQCECPMGGNTCVKEGDTKCGPGMGLQTCTKSGACFEWSTEKACDAGICAAISATKAACPACPKIPSSRNLVPNPGFDKNLGGWTGDLGGEDASACPLSKSLLLVGTPGDDGSILPASAISPCFALPTGRKYNFGAALRRAAGSKVACYLLVWTDSATCEAAAATGQRLDSVDNSLAGLNQWDRSTVEIPAQPGDRWARVNCQADGKGFVDEVFVSQSPGGTF
jgi:hypothetical protein